MKPIGPKNAERSVFSIKLAAFFLVECFFVACLFSIYAGSRVPEVNESHYWTKAKHFWDPSFASGDLFLASADAHWFFFLTVGGLANWLSLPAAAWCGRIIGWLAVACGWCLFVRRLRTFRLAGALAAPLWVASVHWGHLSGEWIVGGCEAKVFAYAFALIGLSQIVVNRWSRAWLWFGFASAFHVLTGAWITLAALLSYGFLRVRLGRSKGNRQADGDGIACRIEIEPLQHQWLGLLLGGCFSLFGLLPAVLLNQGVESATAEKGAFIYVYQRLPHHLSPIRFGSERWVSFSILVAMTLIFAFGYRQVRWMPQESGIKRSEFSRCLVPLFVITGIVSAIAVVGVLIDIGLSSWATNWSASLLRFYWFRWNDVIWPTLLTVLVIKIVELGSKNSSFFWRFFAAIALGLPGPILLGIRWFEHDRATLPPADQASLVLRTESTSTRKRIYKDWLDVCYWIRSNTPSDSMFLTPRFQQTFKWYAHRSEVACWKDAPQNAKALIEWQQRMLEIFPRSKEGYGLPMSIEHLTEMRLKYNLNYVIIDHRFQKQPPLLPIVHSNGTYDVFEFP